MKAAKRWGVMALVAMLVLGSMGAALADEATEPESAKEPPAPGSESPEYDWAGDLLAFVFYWGLGEGEDPPPCETPEPDPGGSIFFPAGDPADDPVECVALNVEGPNGQVNHGSMVSSFVHWLKGDEAKLKLSEELQDMPKGQLVKRFAHEDFGKGFFDFDGEDEGLEGAVGAEDGDGHGPPEWVKAKKAAKAEAKGRK